MKISLNGEELAVDDGVTIVELVRQLGREPGRGVAVAVNGEVIPRSVWEAAVISEADSVEILNAIGGG